MPRHVGWLPETAHWHTRLRLNEMNCTTCGHGSTRVVDSRESHESVRRRRECPSCSARFTTYERVHSSRLMVEKRDGERQTFSLEKLERSILVACAKRPLPLGAVEQLALDVHVALTDDGKEVVASQTIGEMVLLKLKRLDGVAYVRYASVFRDYSSPEGFAAGLEDLSDELPPADRVQARLLAGDALSRLSEQASGR